VIVAVVCPRTSNVRSTASAPTATPTAIDTCWATATSDTDRAGTGSRSAVAAT